MAGAKEIRAKIASIKSTQKITRAMEMVAASKMRKAQERRKASKPYAQRVRAVVSHLAKGRLEYQHSYTVERSVKRVGYLVVSSDRGLCGGLNINLFKKVLASMKQWQEQQVAISMCTIGKKAESFFSRHGARILASATHLGDAPLVKSLIGVIKILLDAYENNQIDRIYLVYNSFINTMTQSPEIEILLPIIDPSPEPSKKYWDYLYEPDAVSLLDTLLRRYIESVVYQGVVENVACEQAARMVAMKSASDNAGELIDEFQLIYNKARQAAITQELSEICAGAAAV